MSPTDTHITRLAEILTTEGRSQAWLARQVGTTRSRINEYCRGLQVPEAKQALIADALGRDVTDVFGEVQG